ncbi:RNA polymerase sigma factor [Flavobacterium silvaticum]|uniref:Sigma-70 family RNA polymerase sigma factor n=1 Tax=Flavobacterium silvaticum TaxID=1852020 RepID=A0A972FTJ5_9FLAO|nr:sigma-70 family RNA polymerase sigma factor [Flavobacterium silvaticum]NMH27320.1 sigma-70 family RNA polymerase sigma factor [Flavobacterium silvaticum]
MLEDREIVAKLLDPATQDVAFRELISEYKRPLYSHIRSIVIDHDDADDVLQNTFVKVFQHVKGFKGESRLFSWVYRIATNEALTFIRQKKRKTGIGDEASHERTFQNLKADTYFDGDEIQTKLLEAVEKLPDKQKLVFRMKYFEELKYEEMSEILGTSVGALKASYHHAVKKIEDYVTRERN